ncbi:helicase [Seminavis robusta]|uniref:Helicase n=1 Tax=Seminavis robusta TaxID=568900 RepID=A0A9N8HW73_9STRA|nr:helicase [Seminavis robusta]|eukprot:Sro1927_g305950.1 helicase (448) ;mRNA; f:14097-15712
MFPVTTHHHPHETTGAMETDTVATAAAVLAQLEPRRAALFQQQYHHPPPTPPTVAVNAAIATTPITTTKVRATRQTQTKKRRLEEEEDDLEQNEDGETDKASKHNTKKKTRKKRTAKRTLPPHLESLYQQLTNNGRCMDSIQKEQQEAARLVAEAQRRLDAANRQAEHLTRKKEILEEQILTRELSLDNNNEFTQHYHQLVAFQQEFGHVNVALERPHGALNAWVKRMRRIKALRQAGDKYQAPQWKYYLRALDRIGFVWDVVKDQWKIQFDKMLAFKQENGHCCIPKAYKKDKALGAWVHRQRYHYKLYHEGKPTQLTPERIQLLKSVGFSWGGDAKSPVDVTAPPRPTKPRNGQHKRTPEQEWEHHFQLLLEFQKQHGHVKISAVQVSHRNNQLRDWAAWQRREYKKWKRQEPSHVTSEHVRRLQEIGFSWEVWPNKTQQQQQQG